MCSSLFLYLRPMRRQSRGFSASTAGLSPRVRGHQKARGAQIRLIGTIPAGAGTPRCSSAPASPTWDYPRGCGDTVTTILIILARLGLSPRVRGHLERKAPPQVPKGTIPAGAGTPSGGHQGRASGGDYPRGCGDTRLRIMVPVSVRGLSPRVRGHPQHVVAPRHRGGTIPAGAGTPQTSRFGVGRAGDYPRGCGDTIADLAARVEPEGLSPRVRGHPRQGHFKALRHGTIPAGAGTPPASTVRRWSAGDYPRGCGDTRAPHLHVPIAQGLSPRVRGHRARRAASLRERGTIPAGAGTPS